MGVVAVDRRDGNVAGSQTINHLVNQDILMRGPWTDMVNGSFATENQQYIFGGNVANSFATPAASTSFPVFPNYQNSIENWEFNPAISSYNGQALVGDGMQM